MAALGCPPLALTCRCGPRSRPPFASAIRRGNVSRAAVNISCQAVSIAAAQKVLDQIRRAGGSADKIVIEESISTGTPVLVASADISSGETIASIPESAWVSPDAVSRSAIGSYMAGLEPWLQIALYILHVRQTGQNDSYVESIPDSMPGPLLWSEEELGLLEGTQLLDNVLAYREFFKGRFSSLQESLFAAHPSIFPAASFSFDRFLWAAATVRSRLHPPLEGADAALVPLADMVTHQRGNNTNWKVAMTGLINRKQVLQVEAGRAYRKGEPISMDYGPQKIDNQLVLDYGVFDRSQKQEGYVLALSLPESDRFLDDKLDILETNGLAPSPQFVLRPGMEPDEDMMAFLRLMQLQKQDVFLLEPLFREEVWGHMMQPVSEFNEELVCQAMIDGAAEALAQYPTSIEDDLLLLRSLNKGSREEVAVQIRLGEKEALNAALLWFEERKSSLKTLEYYQERRLKRLGLVDEKGRTTFDGFFKGGIA